MNASAMFPSEEPSQSTFGNGNIWNSVMSAPKNIAGKE